MQYANDRKEDTGSGHCGPSAPQAAGGALRERAVAVTTSEFSSTERAAEKDSLLLSLRVFFQMHELIIKPYLSSKQSKLHNTA